MEQLNDSFFFKKNKQTKKEKKYWFDYDTLWNYCRFIKDLIYVIFFLLKHFCFLCLDFSLFLH